MRRRRAPGRRERRCCTRGEGGSSCRRDGSPALVSFKHPRERRDRRRELCRQADTCEEKCDNCWMMRRRSWRTSSDDARYSCTLLAYARIHWTFNNSLLVRSFYALPPSLSFSMRTKKASEGEREADRKKRIRLEAKGEKESRRIDCDTDY